MLYQPKIGSAPTMVYKIPSQDADNSTGWLSVSNYTIFNTGPSICYSQNDNASLVWNYNETNVAYEPIGVQYDIGISDYAVFTNSIPDNSNPNLPYGSNFCEVSYYYTLNSSAASVGGKRSSQSGSTGMVYSFVNQVNDEWYYKAPALNNMRITPPKEINNTLLFNNQLQNQIVKFTKGGFSSFKLFSLDGKLILHGAGTAQNISNQLNSKSNAILKGMYLLTIIDDQQHSSTSKIINN